MNVDQVLEQTQWDFFWLPPDAGVVDRSEVQYVHCSRDITVLNTVTRLRASADALPKIVDEVRGAHAGVRSRFMLVPQNSKPDICGVLGGAGYAPGDRHLACAISVSEYARKPPDNVVVQVVHRMGRLRDWHRVVSRAFGEPHVRLEADLRRELGECSGPGARVHRVVAYDRGSDEPLAAGGLTLFRSLGFGLLWGAGTVPHARGRGAYTAVMGARLAFARSAGLSHVGLYARIDTSAPIVQRQGFAAHGEMVFWRRDKA